MNVNVTVIGQTYIGRRGASLKGHTGMELRSHIERADSVVDMAIIKPILGT